MTCPICSRESNAAYRPFCCKRCANLDLGNWLNGSYSVPSDDPEDMEPNPPEPDRNTPRPH